MTSTATVMNNRNQTVSDVSPYAATSYKKRPRSSTTGVDTSYGHFSEEEKQSARELCESVGFALRHPVMTTTLALDGAKNPFTAKKMLKPCVAAWLKSNP